MENMKLFHTYTYDAQYQCVSGLVPLHSQFYTPFILDAARCSGDPSSVVWAIDCIRERFRRFTPYGVFDPIEIVFSASGVHIRRNRFDEHVFAVYEMRVMRVPFSNGFYTIVMDKYTNE